jgi:ABC-type multidrug transport system fused ATPase/permease subunit
MSTAVILLWGPYLGVVALLVAAGSAFAVGIAALHRADGALSSVELLTILLISRECFRPLKELEDAYHDSLPFRSSAHDIFSWLDTTVPVRSGLAHAAPSGGLTLAFENVAFWYEGSNPPALEKFDLEVSAGERVALVGRSGAGKTTVISLLLRFFDPQFGRVRIGGRDIRDFSLTSLRCMIAVVSQDTYLFHGSIRDNLLLARPNATDAELHAAARAAHIHNFVSTLPDGYETKVGERGLTLSGGERQRLAIARALLKDAPILVLDEATSHLDSANESGIQAAMERLSEGRLTLVIAHRLSTVRNLDRVILIDRGRIVEQGSHDALIARGGAYSQLAAAQGMAS